MINNPIRVHRPLGSGILQEALLSDFSGKTLMMTGREGRKAVEIVVCVLPFSGMIFVTAVKDQSLASWTRAHSDAFAYFGGVTSKLIVDNLKAAVVKWMDREAVLNPTFADFARHYKVAVLPARRGRPRDKGVAESAVGTVQTRILAALRHVTFFTLEDINARVHRELDKLNCTVMASYEESRLERFEPAEREHLQALPARRWDYAERFDRKVGPNYHVALEKNHYSVPHGWIGHEVRLRISRDVVEIFALSTGEALAVHPRLRGVNQYATTKVHLLAEHAAILEQRQPGYGQWVIDELSRIGPCTGDWARRCLRSRDFPVQSYNSLRGVLTLAHKHAPGRLEEACAAALLEERYSSGFLRDWLKQPITPASPEESEEWQPSQTHVRGSGYYKANDGEDV